MKQQWQQLSEKFLKLSSREMLLIFISGLVLFFMVPFTLMVEGNLQVGDSVLIQGTGGMSIAALQFAKAAGAKISKDIESTYKKAEMIMKVKEPIKKGF